MRPGCAVRHINNLLRNPAEISFCEIKSRQRIGLVASKPAEPRPNPAVSLQCRSQLLLMRGENIAMLPAL
ncbi:MAG: hypothetical protein CM15mP120_16920 [Pseudomonadota bacterium]|nr:MAG: hypothetical protein CM15mP120_16920 [Pseudomonadota bacterium]